MNERPSEIWPQHEVFYIHALLFNTRSAIDSLEQIETSIQRLPQGASEDPLENLDTDALLNSLQNVVVQGAALSRYFWPARRGHEKRANLLRAALGVAEESPLKSRDLRNQIEHFDEKLDIYLARDITGYIIPQYVGLLPQSDGVPSHIFRAFYLDVGLFEMLGQRYKMQPIAEEICRIHERLVFLDKHGGRLRAGERSGGIESE